MMMISKTVSRLFILIALAASGVFGLSLEGLRQSSYEGRPKQTRSMNTSQHIQVCGFRLLEAVRVICLSRGGGYMMTRRSDPSLTVSPLYDQMEIPMSMDNSLDGGDSSSSNFQYPNDFPDSSALDFPDGLDFPSPSWASTPSRLAILKSMAESKAHPRYRRNIIDECCKRPCPRGQLAKYCVRT